MIRGLLIILCILPSSSFLFAQHVTLHHLIGFHSQNDSIIYNELKEHGWRYHGIQYDVPRKPRMYAFDQTEARAARLYLYSYQKKPLCKVELICNDVEGFNAAIRDSLSAYGFLPELERGAPDEENLRITSSAYFVNNDAAVPVHALILYFEERNKPKVSLTIYSNK